MADVCEAFCLFRVFCGLKFRVFRAFRGSKSMVLQPIHKTHL